MKLKPNIILIVIDSVRYDHCSYSGYTHKTTPNLDDIKGGIYFHNAFSPSTWSPPAYASIFTGLYPTQHGVQGISEESFAREAPRISTQTFVEDLKKMGYKTVAFSRNPIICPLLGFNRGFDEYIELPVTKFFDSFFNIQRRENGTIIGAKSLDPSIDNLSSFIKRSLRKIKRWMYWYIGHNFLFYYDSKDINKRIKKRLSKIDNPFFLFISYMDVHDYHFSLKNGLKDLINFLINKFKNSKTIRYNTALSYLDHNLNKLFKILEDEKCLDNTAIIVVSDHGEMLGERGLSKHGYIFPYKELIHVPLIVKDPFNNGKKIDVNKPISIKEVANIIKYMAEGKSSFNLIKMLPEWCGFDGVGIRAILTYDNLLIHNLKKDEFKLYDAFNNNILKNNTLKLNELLNFYRKWESELQKTESKFIFSHEEEEEILKRLKRLGYVED